MPFSTIKKIDVSESEINSYKSESEFSFLGVEIAKEVGQIFAIVLNISTDGNFKYKRNKAVIYALGNRMLKLLLSVIENYCNLKTEIVQIINRCLIEAYIDASSLMNSDTDKIFDEYIKYTLKDDIKLYKTIKEQVKNRGFELAIEKRMIASIEHYCNEANLKIEDIANLKQRSWGGNSIYDRFKNCNRELLYEAYRMCGHSVHGGWVNMLMFDLIKEDEEYVIKTESCEPTVKILIPILIFLCDFIQNFINYNFGSPTREELLPRIKDLENRLIKINRLHEKAISENVL